jgi:hypothetical protein
MDIFYTIVLSISTVILILILTYIGVSMVYYKKKLSYPPHSASCPDTWAVLPSDPSSCVIPACNAINTGKLYDGSGTFIANSKSGTYGITSSTNSINFSDAGWTSGGLTSQCGQKAWANQMGIQWDGISNYNQC